MLFVSSILRRTKAPTLDNLLSFSVDFRNRGCRGATRICKQIQSFDVTGMAALVSSMSFELFLNKWLTLNSSVEALAAIGAELRLRREELKGDSRVRVLLQDVVHSIDPGLLDDLDAKQESSALALIQTSFRQSIDLLENPARAPGWNYEDPDILESQGEVSRQIVRGINLVAAQRPDLGATLQKPGAFLDVGTGVGRLAIEAARSWPLLRVIGIDPWEPALCLARKNLAQSDVAGRVEFRLQRIEDLDDETIFSLGWHGFPDLLSPPKS
jgi:hypothetical protein